MLFDGAFTALSHCKIEHVLNLELLNCRTRRDKMRWKQRLMRRQHAPATPALVRSAAISAAAEERIENDTTA
jgi:hypothetical protein